MANEPILHRAAKALIADKLVAVLVMALPVLGYATGFPLLHYRLLIDWPTIGTLTGLLLLTKGIELSGLLQSIGHKVITRMHSERHLAVLLVVASALLAMVLSNDVALFIVVPLTLGLHGMARLPTVRLVVFEALAVNAGSTLTPIGNPQNLYLWQSSGLNFNEFVVAMAPLAAMMSGLLLALTVISFGDRRIETVEDLPPPSINRPQMLISLILFGVFLALVDQHRIAWGLALVMGVYFITGPKIFARCDWNLILIFLMMFLDLKLLARLDFVQALLSQPDPTSGATAFFQTILASQIISNVPATLLLSSFHDNWQALAYGADVGGYGLMIGSLANLIALRLLGNRRGWLVFHGFSLPFLGLVGTLTYFFLPFD